MMDTNYTSRPMAPGARASEYHQSQGLASVSDGSGQGAELDGSFGPSATSQSSSVLKKPPMLSRICRASSRLSGRSERGCQMAIVSSRRRSEYRLTGHL